MSAGKLMALVITETMKLIGDRRLRRVPVGLVPAGMGSEWDWRSKADRKSSSRVGVVHAADLALRHLEINRAYGNLIHHDW
jgi:hypothetical protein